MRASAGGLENMGSVVKRQRAWVRIFVDVAMAVLFIVVMATALVQEAPHEYVGIALFVAVVAHIVLNRRWFKALFRGRYNAVRVLQLVAVVGLLACIIGQVVSSLVLSKYAFGFLPAFPGASWARRAHMLCSYWSFVFAFAHAGFQFKGFSRLVKPKGSGSPSAAVLLGRIAVIVVACYGAYAFVQVNMGAYLLGQIEFAFADFAIPPALMCARYAAIAVLVAAAFYCLCRVIEALGKRN